MSAEREALTETQFLLSDYFKPLIYFIPFFVVVLYIKTIDDLKYLANIISLSLLMLSIIIIVINIFLIRDWGNVDSVNQFYLTELGMHRNAIADFYILAFPLSLGIFFYKKNWLSFSSLGINFIAAGFTYSRTSYLTILIAIVLFLIISKRAKLIPVYIIVGIILSFAIATSIIQRLRLVLVREVVKIYPQEELRTYGCL